MDWQHLIDIPPLSYVCGYCGHMAGPNKGYKTASQSNGFHYQQKAYHNNTIYICTYCYRPTYFYHSGTAAIQTPGARYGDNIQHLPDDVGAIYDEARNCMSLSSYTGAVLLCRKLLMHIAVDKGAKPKLTFAEYIDYLATKGYVGAESKPWVDHIRSKSNEANHQIVIMSRQDAEELLTFSAMLLRIIFEFPARLAPPSPPP